MQKDLNTIVADVREKTPSIKTRAEFEAFKATISGPKGALTDVMKGMGKVTKEDKPAMGKAINEAKMAVEAAFASVIEGLEAAELAAKIGPAIDPTLPPPSILPKASTRASSTLAKSARAASKLREWLR